MIFFEVYKPWEVSHVFTRETSCRINLKSYLGTPQGSRYGRTDERANGRTGERTDERTDVRADGRAGGRTGGRTDERAGGRAGKVLRLTVSPFRRYTASFL